MKTKIVCCFLLFSTLTWSVNVVYGQRFGRRNFGQRVAAPSQPIYQGQLQQQWPQQQWPQQQWQQPQQQWPQQQWQQPQQYPFNGQQFPTQPAITNQTTQQQLQQPQAIPQSLNSAAQPKSNSTQHWTLAIAPPVRHHDFGVVPSFSDQEFVFEFENTLDQAVELVGVRASCGCTKPSILTKTVAPGAKGKVLAKFDTRNFKGLKKATVSVSVRKNQPYIEYGEIQFSVKGKIRRDVVLNPGTVTFDDITLGKGAKRTFQVLYAGNPNWQITDIKSSNPNIKIESKELQRQSNRVDYELTVHLDENQSVGSFLDKIQVHTNDQANKNLTINVQGNVKSVVQVSPVRLGVVSKDQKIEKRLIVRGARPFSIKTVSTGDDRILFTPSEGNKTLHILTYKLDTSSTGQIRSRITIETDDPDQHLATVPFEAQIVPATFALDAVEQK